MRTRVLFFGLVKEATGLSEDTVTVCDGETVGSVFARYAERFPALAGLRPSLMLARNQRFCRDDEPVAAGDEIAFLPPVSGG